MASFETLLRRVRSETPISFFLVVSKVAFFGFAPPPPAWPPAATAPPCLAPLSFRRFVIPCDVSVSNKTGGCAPCATATVHSGDSYHGGRLICGRDRDDVAVDRVVGCCCV